MILNKDRNPYHGYSVSYTDLDTMGGCVCNVYIIPSRACISSISFSLPLSHPFSVWYTSRRSHKTYTNYQTHLPRSWLRS